MNFDQIYENKTSRKFYEMVIREYKYFLISENKWFAKISTSKILPFVKINLSTGKCFFVNK